MSKETKEQTNPPTHAEDPLLSLGEVARQLGKHRATINSWVRDGLLSAIRLPSGLHAVRKSEVNKLLDGTRIEGRVS